MERRKALKQIGWGLSGGILMPSLLNACAPKDPAPEVVYDGTVGVIGAGAAGLYLADILRTKGVKVVVFEARDQIGGRIRSLRNQSIDQYPYLPQMSSDFPIELGAQTIVGSDSILGKVFQAYNLATTEFLPSGHNFVMDGKVKSEADWGSDPDFLAAKNFKTNVKSYSGSSLSVQQEIVAAAINSRAHGMLNGQIGNAYGSTNEKIGIGALGEAEKLRTNDGKILGPKTNPMHDVLISRFNSIQSLVQLSTPIASINYSTDPITLTAKDGTTHTVNKVVVTVPISILKNGSLAFSPALPTAITSSLTKFAMGASLRVVLEFKKNFWGDTVGFIFGTANVPEYFSVGVGRSLFNRTLSVTVNGEKASQYSALGDGVVEVLLADLDLIYNKQATQFIRQDLTTLKNIFVRHDWTKTDYILGGYAYPLPGAKTDDRKAIGQSVNKKLFFAGEATDITGQAGMVNGALASAERAAQQVVESINNP